MALTPEQRLQEQHLLLAQEEYFNKIAEEFDSKYKDIKNITTNDIMQLVSIKYQSNFKDYAES
jgi:hypothetical protein